MLKKTWLPILLAFIFPLVMVYAWWGGFHSVQITQQARGPYIYAYLEHHGKLSKLPDTQNKVWRALVEQNITPGNSINVVFDDPRHVAGNQLRAHTGYLIQTSDKLQAPLLRGEIAKRPVLVAQVQAAALLAPGKTYQALYDYLQAQQRDIVMPTVELYESAREATRAGVFTVEMKQ